MSDRAFCGHTDSILTVAEAVAVTMPDGEVRLFLRAAVACNTCKRDYHFVGPLETCQPDRPSIARNAGGQRLDAPMKPGTFWKDKGPEKPEERN